MSILAAKSLLHEYKKLESDTKHLEKAKVTKEEYRMDVNGIAIKLKKNSLSKAILSEIADNNKRMNEIRGIFNGNQ